MEDLRLSIITMYCGESEFDKCVEMVSKQKCSFYFEQCFIKNKSNAEAHNELYNKIMIDSSKFDYFVKLDADMVFKNDTALQDLVALVVKSGADIFSVPVHDYMTDSMIWGANIYKSGVRWKLGTENLFTDQQLLDGDFTTAKKNLSFNNSVISHAENPSDFQAFVFGVHRAAKVVQTESDIFLLGHSWGQLNTLFKVVAAYSQYGDKKRALAIIGAYYTLNNINKNVGLNRKDDFLEDFNSIDFENDLAKSLHYFRSSKIFIFVKSIGLNRVLIGLFEYFKRKLM